MTQTPDANCVAAMAVAPVVSIRRVRNDPFIWASIALLSITIACVVWIFVVVSKKLPEDADDPFVLVYFAARIMQLTLGMLIGLVLTVFGVVMAWFGVTQEMNASVGSPDVKASVVSAGPGALLVVCGTTIILFCLSLKLEVSAATTTNQPVGAITGPQR